MQFHLLNPALIASVAGPSSARAAGALRAALRPAFASASSSSPIATSARAFSTSPLARAPASSTPAARSASGWRSTGALSQAGLGFAGLPRASSVTSLLRSRVSAFASRRCLATAAAEATPAPSAAGPSSSAPPPKSDVPLTDPMVARYLFLIAGMVFTIVVVGGMTRLTESGLSITEWNLVTGVLPPLGQADWESEFEKYRATPEWRINNTHMTLSEFKSIYFWEWSHRILGRVIGLTFLAPIPYFLLRRKLSPKASLSLLGIGTLIGGQGALGWYMVKSGLDEQSVNDLGGVPRVSQYRLAAHLGMAFAVYAASLRLALGIGRDWKLSQGKGLAGWQTVEQSVKGLNGPVIGRVRAVVTVLTGMVFLTAISGAFVAGLDAGLVYNEFPLMGGRLAPPASELLDSHYSRKPDRSDMWRNFFENPTTVQFDHRLLAMTTFTGIVSLFLYARRPHIRAALPPTAFRLIKGSLHMSLLQVALGISTLVYMVPIHLAATHQAGSLVLLSLLLASGASLRRPGRVVQEIMKLRAQKRV